MWGRIIVCNSAIISCILFSLSATAENKIYLSEHYSIISSVISSSRKYYYTHGDDIDNIEVELRETQFIQSAFDSNKKTALKFENGSKFDVMRGVPLASGYYSTIKNNLNFYAYSNGLFYYFNIDSITKIAYGTYSERIDNKTFFVNVYVKKYSCLSMDIYIKLSGRSPDLKSQVDYYATFITNQLERVYCNG